MKKTHLQNVQLDRDYSSEIEIIGGLNGSEFVGLNPGGVVREEKLVKAGGPS